MGHGTTAVVEGLLQGDAGAFPAAAGRGEEPVGIAVPGPEDAQTGKQLGADRNFARLAALGVGDAQDQARAVDVLGPDMQRLAQAQAALIDEGEVGAVTAVAEGAQELGDFLAGEHVGQRLDALDIDFRPDLPVLAEVVAVKRAQGTDGLVEGGAGELAFGLEVDEEVEDAGRFEVRQRSAGEVIGKLGGPAEVGLDGAPAQAFEMDEAEVVLIPIGGDKTAASGCAFFSWRTNCAGLATPDEYREHGRPREGKSPRSGSVQQDAPSNGGQRPSLISSFQTRRG